MFNILVKNKQMWHPLTIHNSFLHLTEEDLIKISCFAIGLNSSRKNAEEKKHEHKKKMYQEEMMEHWGRMEHDRQPQVEVPHQSVSTYATICSC